MTDPVVGGERNLRSLVARGSSSRLTKVWLLSTVSRATVVPLALFAAAFLRNDDASVLALTALSALGGVGAVVAFMYDASVAANRRGRFELTYVGTVAVVGAAGSAWAGDATALAALTLVVAFVGALPVTRHRQRLLLSGLLGLPYFGVILRSAVLLAVLATVGRSDDSSTASLGVAMAFLASTLVEAALYGVGRSRSRTDALVATPLHQPGTASLALAVGHTLSCALPWLLRLVVSTAIGVEALRFIEYADRFSYLAVSGVLGGLATELQRRWQTTGRSVRARQEATAMSAALYATGVGAGVLAAIVAPRVFEHAPVSSIITIVVLGFAAGANGAMTVVQRLVLAAGEGDRLGRLLLTVQAATVVGVTLGGANGLLAGSIAYAVGPTVLAAVLLRPRGTAADAPAPRPLQADPCDA